jgi:cation diffusion facilitator family transporter
VADSGNQALLLLGRRRALQEETEEHQFGFGAERYFYAFVVAVVLFTVGALFSLYEGIERIRQPEQVSSPAVAFAVLFIAIALESFSLRTAVNESNQSRGGASWLSFIRRAKAPELPAVLLEDVAALTGLIFALVGVALATATGDGRWDGAGSIAIGVLLGCVAAVLAVEMKSLLIGESASVDAERKIVAAILAGPEVGRVIHLRTLHVGPDTLLVAAKIAVAGSDSAARIAAGIDAAERRIRAAVPIAEHIFLEPDLYQPARVDAADPAVRAAQRSRRGAMSWSAIRSRRRGQERLCRARDGSGRVSRSAYRPPVSCADRDKLVRGQLADHVPAADGSGHDDPGVQAAEPQSAAHGRVDKAQGVEAEPGGELGAAPVRLVGNLDNRRAQGQPGAGLQVSGAEIEVDVELIAGQLAPGRVLGDEQGGAGVHDVQLHARMRRPIRGAAAGSLRPAVADEASLRVEGAFGEYLTLVDGGPAHDQLDRAAVPWRIPDVIEAGFQRDGTEMLHAAMMSRSCPCVQIRSPFWLGR